MNHPKILVTGAVGKTGRAVVEELRKRDWPVRAVVRARDARSERLERLGAEIVVADLFDYASMVAAMRGTRRAYFCPPFHPHMVQSAVVFALAARDARLESIVCLTQWLASSEHPSHATRQHWLADRLFEMLPDIALTSVNPGLFADEPYLSTLRYAAHLGIYPMPASGASRNAPPSTEDIARVAAGALVDPAKHRGKTYRPTGPDLLSLDDMVATLGEVLGRNVRHVKLPMWMFYKAARMDGIDPFLLSTFEHYVRELEAGTFAWSAPTDDVRLVTGREPESFETVARRHAARSGMQRTFRNGLRSVADFALVPFAPGIDPDRYTARLRLPLTPAPRYDLESARWKSEHSAISETNGLVHA